MGKKFWITAIVAAFIGLISVIGVIIGIVLHQEETFLPTCLPETEGNNLYTSIHEDHCPVISWEEDAFPLCVELVGKTVHTPQSRSVEDALIAVNRNFKRKIFLPAWDEQCRGEGQYYVSIFLQRPFARHWFEKGGHVTFRRERFDGRLRATVYIGNTPSDGVLHYVLMHELGHVLFLKHDEYESSIMFHEVGDPLLFSKKLGSVLSVQHFSDTDVDAIHEQYPMLPPL